MRETDITYFPALFIVMSPQTKNILVTAFVLSVLVTILVIWNTPSVSEMQKQQRRSPHLLKVFIASFVLTAVVLYIMQDNEHNSMMTNIIKGDPDF